MKTLHLAIIIGTGIAVGLLGSFNNAFAPCAGVTNCGPPPGVTVDIWTDNQFYEKNDTILLRGHVYLENYTNPMQIRLVDPQNKIIQNFTATVTENNTFAQKIVANFNETGQYQFVACLNSWCERSYFKYFAEPYKLTFNNRTSFIKYKTTADLAGIDVDINDSALIVHITNATSTGQQLVLELPRTLIDAKIGVHDTSFKVLVGQIQAKKFMKIADYKEIATTNESRTLAIYIPYDTMTDAAGVWDFMILVPDIPSGPSFFSIPPLKQYEYGMYAEGVHCQNDLLLVLKAEDGSPACITPDTVQKLLERGWTKEVVTPNLDVIHSSCDGTTVLPPNYHAMMFPVLLMQPNSFSCVKLTYTVIRPYGVYEGGVNWPRNETLPLLHISDLNYEGNANQFGITQGKNYTNSFNISVFPKTIDHANYPVGSNFTVTYLIKPLPNATGFYDQSVPMPICFYYPLAVGHTAKEVNASDFSKGMSTMLNHSCFRGQEELVGVEIKGMSYTEIKLQ